MNFSSLRASNFYFQLLLILALGLNVNCGNDDEDKTSQHPPFEPLEYIELPNRPGSTPQTTSGIPHMQIDVEPITSISNELSRRVYSIPGIVDLPSVVSPWRALSLSEDLLISTPDAIIGGREFAHIHLDGSLHIFLEPKRAEEAISTGWAVLHPFAEQRLEGYEGFVMLYTPLSINQLDVCFQLIVDGYNYVALQKVIATDFYE